MVEACLQKPRRERSHFEQKPLELEIRINPEEETAVRLLYPKPEKPCRERAYPYAALDSRPALAAMRCRPLAVGRLPLAHASKIPSKGVF